MIEACSPTNAIAAMGLGMDHATALPCEIAIKAVNWDGVDGNEILMVTYLDPHFMFSALFSDAFDELSDEQLEEFMALPPRWSLRTCRRSSSMHSGGKTYRSG